MSKVSRKPGNCQELSLRKASWHRVKRFIQDDPGKTDIVSVTCLPGATTVARQNTTGKRPTRLSLFSWNITMMLTNKNRLKPINTRNTTFGAKTLLDHTLSYPIEHVVRFMASLRDSADNTRTRQGVDIGFGSGQHLKLLMEHGYRASGVELVDSAIDRVHQLFEQEPLLGDLFLSDFRTAPFPETFFDALICWGVIFLRSLQEMQHDLDSLYKMTHPGGQLCLNFRTKENWFYGHGKEISEDHYLLDQSAGPYAGSNYTFVDANMARQLVEQAGYQIINFERCDWWKNNMQQKHSWWIVWARRPEENLST